MSRHSFVYPFLLAVAFYVVAAGAYTWMFGFRPVSDVAAWGLFGDFMGGVLNPALALITILLLLSNILLQREELKEAKEKARKDDLFTRADQAIADLHATLRESVPLVEETFVPQFDDDDKTRHVPQPLDVLISNPSRWGIANGYEGTLQMLAVQAKRQLAEIAHYLHLIDSMSDENRVLTDYYRRRSLRPLRFVEEQIGPRPMLRRALKATTRNEFDDE